MEKLKFEFVVKAFAGDSKTSSIAVTSIETVKKEVFSVPTEWQHIDSHEKLKNTAAYKKVKTTLTKRGNSRRVWITLDEETLKTYKDEDGNMTFKDYLLEEMEKSEQDQPTKHTTGISAEALQKILENFAETNKKEQPLKLYNLKKFSEKFVIENFTGKNTNVQQWMEIFESECTRLGITEDIDKIEILRLFLEDSCKDWYSSMLMKNTLTSEWKKWKKNFCETYADKGWNPVRQAMGFRYMNGSLLDYALKKERLLLNVNKSLDNSILIDLIAVGLPNFIADKINRSSLKETEDLFNEIRGLESVIKVKDFERKNKTFVDNKARRTEENNPCEICKNQKNYIRYHPESICWFNKNKDKEKKKMNQIKTVNSSELEIELNENIPKKN